MFPQERTYVALDGSELKTAAPIFSGEPFELSSALSLEQKVLYEKTCFVVKYVLGLMETLEYGQDQFRYETWNEALFRMVMEGVKVLGDSIGADMVLNALLHLAENDEVEFTQNADWKLK